MNSALCASSASLGWGKGRGTSCARLQGPLQGAWGSVSLPPPAKFSSQPSLGYSLKVVSEGSGGG